MQNPLRYFNSAPEVIGLTALTYSRSPLSLRQVEDLLFEPGIDISHETVRPAVGSHFGADSRATGIRYSLVWAKPLGGVRARIS